MARVESGSGMLVVGTWEAFEPETLYPVEESWPAVAECGAAESVASRPTAQIEQSVPAALGPRNTEGSLTG